MANEEIRPIKLESLHVASFHHRTIWGDMPGLRDSIAANGVIEPLVVRARSRADGGGYEIGAGVRRHKAAGMAGLKTAPCVVRELSDEDMIAMQVDENRQREGLHPLDEALYCEEYSKRGLQPEAIAKRLGLKKRDVLRRMALLALGKQARSAFVAGRFDEEAALSLAAGCREPARQKDVLAALEAGALQPEEITSYVRRTFTASLDDVPWRMTDEKLVVRAGACSTCPKRSDVQRDLFPEGTAGLRCLDVDCHRGKMDASWTALTAASEILAERGQALTDQGAEALFVPAASGGRPVVLSSSGMVDADGQCPHLEGRTWREAVAKVVPEDGEFPTVYLARDQDGRPRFLFREAIVGRLVKRSDDAKAEAERRATTAPSPAEGEAPAPNPRAEGRARRKLVAKIAEVACSSDYDTWAWVAERVVRAASARSQGAAIELLAEALRSAEATETADGLVALAQTSNRQARRVATAVALFEEADAIGEVGSPVRQLAELCGIDYVALEREIRGGS